MFSTVFLQEHSIHFEYPLDRFVKSVPAGTLFRTKALLAVANEMKQLFLQEHSSDVACLIWESPTGAQRGSERHLALPSFPLSIKA